MRGKRTAQVLDLTVPLSLLFQADEVIRSNLAMISWVIVAFDTAGEVPAALVRGLGVEKIWWRDVEVYDASPAANRTHPT